MTQYSKIYKNFFISGKPGAGKTTLVREVTLPILDRAGGFYTEEILDESGKLSGFKLKTLSGLEGILASKNLKSVNKLNKYGIDLNVLESMGVKALTDALRDKELIVIDELGTMAAISGAFREAFVKCVASEKKLLATLRYNSQPYTQETSMMVNSFVVTLTNENYPEIKQQLKYWLEQGNTKEVK
ncbi:MAG: hypothetical protein A2297_01540 [Elusimicrobia bacterium RIFOXYB2_FULL_48_7]|nr:MAG: hypothetical protein A2297_01540 [Elusimicrobia bacterium RIFOXYB2_FULL_48_7]